MGVVSGIVLYAIIWFMTLFVILPFRMKTQGDAGETVMGTPASAPTDPQLRRRFIVTSLISAVIWLVVAGIIVFEIITLDDIDLFTRFGMGSPPP